MKTIKELEAERETPNSNGYHAALKDVLGLIDELMSQYGCFGLEKLKARIEG